MDNKKKKFNTNRVAAYALSGVMLASVIPYNVFANAEVLNDKIQSEQGLEFSQNKEQVPVGDAAEPEDTSTSADAKDAVHGYVGVLVGGDINADLAAETGQRFKPIGGVKVYFQWYEKEGNRTSPTYFATSGADGQFHIKAKPYIGEDGKLVKFDADTTSSAGTESYKMWVDESTIPEGYQLQYSTGEGVEFTDRRVAGGGYQLGPNRLVNYRVLLMEKQDEEKMHKKAEKTGPQIYSISPGQGAVRGKVSWDYESAGGVQWGIVSTPTSPAGGVTVTASYLSDHALKQIYSADTANMLGLSSPSNIRGSGWTFKLETQLQNWIAEQVAADKENWIAETVSAVTNDEGDYKIQFKGTWGPRWNDESVANYTAPNRWSKKEKERLGTVAENAKDGSFLTGALTKNQKHINSNWLFISTKDTDDVVKRTPWNYNWYTGSNNAWGIHGGWAQAGFGVSTVQAAHSTRADFNLAPAEIKFNITNFDTQANTATPGDIAKTNTQGLPYKNTNDSFKIVWYDQEGNKIKQELTQKPTSTGGLAEAKYDTKNVTETSTFIAKLHYVKPGGGLGQVLAQDAFTVKVNDKIGSRYEDVEFSNGETENTSYKASGLPNGLTIDEATGKVTGKPTEAGKFTVTTTISVPADDEEAEDISVDKVDQYIITDSPLEDGNKDEAYDFTIVPEKIEGYVFKNVKAEFIEGKKVAGLTITGDKIEGTPTELVEATQENPNVKVTYDIYQVSESGEFLVKKGHVDNVPLSIKEGEATKYEPVYEDAEGTVGEKATVAAPTFTNKEGNPATPEGEVSYELGKDAPEGAEVKSDGSVTYTPTTDDVGNTVNIPVVVKYSDGTTDDAVAKIKVADPQNMDYEPEYKEVEAKAGEDATSTPIFKDADGGETTAPEDAKFTLGAGYPEGASVDETSGVVTYKPSIDKAGDTVKVPVVVTYKDGSTDKAEAPFKVAEADNANYTAEYTPVTAQVGHEATVASPEFYNKKDGSKAEPEVQKYEMGTAVKEGDEEATPIEGVTINDKTGEIKYTAKDADKDSVIEVPVTVTYKDGSKENTIARINVPSDADLYNPEGKELETNKGETPEAKEGVKFTLTPPEATKYEWKTEPDVSKAGETVGIVKITYPDGTTDEVSVDVYVKDTTPVEKTATPAITEPKAGDTKVTGTATPGATVKVTLPDGTVKETTADDEGNWSVDTPALEKDQKVKAVAQEDGKDPSEEATKTVAEAETPAEKTATPAITEPKAGDTKVTGTATPGATVKVTLPDGTVKETTADDEGNWSVDTPALEKDQKVKAVAQEDGKDPSEEATKTVAEADETQTDAQKNPAVEPDKTEVKDKTSLTDEEKAEVEQKVKDKNPEAKDVTVGDDGSVTITYPDGTTNTLTPEQTVTEKTTGQTDADKNPAVAPDKTEVEDKNNLTPEEKDKVKEEVKKANPKASDVTVDDKGNAELTYPDGSKNTIPADKTVTEKDTGSTGGNDGYRPGHGGSDVFDGLFRRHDYTPTYPVKTVVPEKTEYGTPVRDTLWYVFHINEFEYEVVRNGVVTKRKMDVTPVLQNDRTMLPLRYVAEALQADVTWDAKTRTATFTKDGLTASIQIDSDEIVLSNGKTVKMDSKPLNINDRILVSVTNVANVFGLTNGNTKDKVDQDIEWEQEDKSATIYIRR